jgi:uncharacterized protein YaaQ
MKLVIAIVQAEDARGLERALVKNNIRSTKMASKGTFLSQGNVTFLIGTEDEKVDQVLAVIKEQSQTREEYVSPTISPANFTGSQPVKVEVGGATIFVVPIDQFKRF